MKYGQLVGIGNTADVYEWEEGKVLKLFHPGYSKNAAENEFHNAIAIRDMDFAKPKVYDMVLCEDRIGIIYDRAEGETLLSWVVRTGDIDGCAEHMAKLHKSIIRNKIDNIMNYKDFLMNGLRKHPSMNLKKQEEIVLKINLLSDGDDLCHGDFHPGNIFLSPDGNTMAIDFMNVCRGNYLYDIARSVFLMEYTPVPENLENREVVLHLKKALSDSYLNQMKVTREMIQEYLSVIMIVRLGEMS